MTSPSQAPTCVQLQVKRENVTPLWGPGASGAQSGWNNSSHVICHFQIEDLSCAQEGMTGTGVMEHWETEIRKFLLDFGDASDVGLLQ